MSLLAYSCITCDVYLKYHILLSTFYLRRMALPIGWESTMILIWIGSCQIAKLLISALTYSTILTCSSMVDAHARDAFPLLTLQHQYHPLLHLLQHQSMKLSRKQIHFLVYHSRQVREALLVLDMLIMEEVSHLSCYQLAVLNVPMSHSNVCISFLHTGGTYVEFGDVDGGPGGACSISFRYANGDSAGNDRPCEVAINGVIVGTIAFTALTDDWYTWNLSEVLETECPAGLFTLRLTAIGSGPNVDHLRFIEPETVTPSPNLSPTTPGPITSAPVISNPVDTYEAEVSWVDSYIMI